MLAQEGSFGLDDKLSEYLPSLPAADRITLRMLANSTAGYVYTPEVLPPARSLRTDSSTPTSSSPSAPPSR